MTGDPRDSISYRQATLRTSLNAAVEVTGSCDQRPADEEEEECCQLEEQEIKIGRKIGCTSYNYPFFL